jgi:hypothetical protein
VFFDKDAMFPLGKYKALAKEGQATKETETAEVVTPVEKNNG